MRETAPWWLRTRPSLAGYGYEGSTASTPAAYLTGMLFAVRTLAAGHDSGILDIGLARAKPGARIFAALKGAVDGGFDVPLWRIDPP